MAIAYNKTKRGIDMAQTKESKWQKIHEEAMQRFDRVQTALYYERQQCLEDRRFCDIAGAMWEGPLGEQFANKPRLEVNKVRLAAMRVINEYRNNRITVDFVPKVIGDSIDDQLADLCDGLYRADEQASNAEEAYDNAFSEAVKGGIGAWRLRNEYEDEEDEDNDCQTICFEPITDADSCVFFDLDSKRQDKRDANWCFVLSGMTRPEYVDEYGDDTTSMPKNVQGSYFDWFTPDFVYIAEYYRKEEIKELWHTFQGPDGTEKKYSDKELKESPEIQEELDATGYQLVKSRKVEKYKVRKYLMSGSRILEDCGYIPGDVIPIIWVCGDRQVIDGVERCSGAIRYNKDAQRILNMLRSMTAQLAVMFKTEKPIFDPEQMTPQIAGMWAEDNIKDYPYLLSGKVTGPDGNMQPSGPIGYTKAPNLPPAIAALLQVTEQDLNDMTGNQQQGEKMVSNISGKAVEMIQQRLDMQAYIYMSNMAKAMKRCGEVWLAMKRAITVEQGRKVRTVGSDGSVGMAELYKPTIDPKTGEVIESNDLSKAKFGVVADVGPTSASKRASTVRALTGMLQISQDPQTRTVLESLALQNMEGEGLGDVREFFRSKLLQIGAVKPTEEEAQQMAQAQANQQPDANTVYLQSAAQKEQALARKAEADTLKSLADTRRQIAEVEQIDANIGMDTARLINETMQGMQPQAPQV